MKKTYSLIIFLVLMSFIFSSCRSSSSNNSEPLTVFVTSVSGHGNLSQWPDALAVSATGVTAGDAVCQARATAAGLSGKFVAWLSDSTTDAYCHVQGFTGTISGTNPNCGQAALPVAAGPWVRTDGYPFANTIDKLINNGQVYAPVRYDETGTLVANFFYFTGTASSGATTANTCSDWTDSTNSSNTTFGASDGTTDFWTSYGDTGCSVTDHLLCFQTGTGGALSGPTRPASAKRVFVTSLTYKGGDLGSVGGGDLICQTLAAAASIPNAANFRAWLSDGFNNAKDRLTTSPGGPWYRLDGVKIAHDKTALAIVPLFTAITRDETGAYNSNSVWTGTDPTGSKTADHCVNWTSSSGGDHGTSGIETESNSGWTTWSNVACNGNAAL
ncbi:MAG: hypothetical protein ABSC54_11035, partial [Smithellaceae bacterium]